jgi:hypothetical protein
MKTLPIRRLAALAVVTLLGMGSMSAQALQLPVDRDSADLVTNKASFVLASVAWSQELGGTTFYGRLGGTLTFHGGAAGCAKVRVIWKNASGAEIADDSSAAACSTSSLPSVPALVGETHSSSNLRAARIELRVKEGNESSYRTVLSRNMITGGN